MLSLGGGQGAEGERGSAGQGRSESRARPRESGTEERKGGVGLSEVEPRDVFGEQQLPPCPAGCAARCGAGASLTVRALSSGPAAALGAVCRGKEQGGGVLAVAHGCPAQHSPSSVHLGSNHPLLPSLRAAVRTPAPLLPGVQQVQQRLGCCLSCRVTWAPAGGFGMGQILHLPSCISPHAGVGFNHSHGSLPAQKIPWFRGTLKVPQQESDICSHQIPASTSPQPCKRCLFPFELRSWGALSQRAQPSALSPAALPLVAGRTWGIIHGPVYSREHNIPLIPTVPTLGKQQPSKVSTAGFKALLPPDIKSRKGVEPMAEKGPGR